MTSEVELSTLDLRYEDFRLKNPALQARLLDGIARRGLEEPLEGVETPDRPILLNGFKRYRCALQLGLRMAPFVSLGTDEAAGIMSLLRTSHRKALSILEQAAFVDDLKTTRQMSVAEIAAELAVSKSWVTMRLGLMTGMSPAVRGALFAGDFPVYSYMYTLRQFMRLNEAGQEQIDAFVAAVSGQKLSIRDIEQLAHGCFRGPKSFREEVLKGNLALPLGRMQPAAPDPDGCNEFERVLLQNLEITQKYMQRIMGKSLSPRLQSRAFHAESHLLTAAILSRGGAFTQTLKQLYDRSGQT